MHLARANIAAIFAALPAVATGSAALAQYPGSSQPGAQQVAPGNLLILRHVPPRNAIIPGAGAAVTAPTAPPAGIFSDVSGVIGALSDSDAASVSGLPSAGQGGFHVAVGLEQVSGSQSVIAGSGTERGGGSNFGGTISGAVNGGMESLRGALNSAGPGG
jgi:hypothetical protein